MSDEPLSRACICGKTIQERSYKRHCSSNYHKSFIQNQKLSETNPLLTTDLVDFAPYLRDFNLSSNKQLTQNVVQKYHNKDRYTNAELELEKKNYDVDHIHEVQIAQYAINRTPGLSLYHKDIPAFVPLYDVLNDVSNLVITESYINRSKGQAFKSFINQHRTNKHMSLLSTLFYTINGEERKIALFSRNIVDTIEN